MSVKVMSLVWYCNISDPVQKSVLIALADRADDHGYCWPGVDNLVIKTAYSRATVMRARKGLVADGWISTVNRSNQGKTNAYRIDCSKLQNSQIEVPEDKEDPELASMFDGGSQSAPPPNGRVSERDGGGSHSETGGGLTLTPNTSVDTSMDTSVKSILSEISAKSTDVTIQRDDVESLCTLLADLVEANGSKRPKISDKWRTDARLLLDRDGRTVDQVQAAIRWSQNDEFWMRNILSMGNLRKHYDRMRLAASAKRSQSHADARNSDLGTDAHLERYIERRRAREAEEAAGGLPANLWDRALAIGEILAKPAGAL